MKKLTYLIIIALWTPGALSFPDSVHGSITKKNFRYLGAFRVPKGEYGQSSFANNIDVSFQYQPLAYNPDNNSLFLAQRTNAPTSAKGIGEISIPEIINPALVDFDISRLETATVLQDVADISKGTFDKMKIGGLTPSEDARAQLGGLFVYNKKLYGTVWGYYDASTENSSRSHWTANIDWSKGYDFSGLHTVGNPPGGMMVSTGGIVGGYIGEIPDKYKEAFGFTLVTGRVGEPIISRSSYGPTLWGFDPASFNGDEPARAEMWIGYTSEHQTLGTYSDSPSLYYTRGTTVQSVIWPAKGDTVLFFGVHGLGLQYDSTGMPVANEDGKCTGPGTSSREEAKTNSWLKSNSPDKYKCGYTVMSSAMIVSGDSCCFDPEDPSRKEHELPYSVGDGQSCYGPGTDDWTYARRNDWLIKNASSGYDCDGHRMSSSDIEAGSGCCYRGSGPTDKGGNAYPTVYQVWSYQVADILDVKLGNRQPYELQPVVWYYDLPFDPDPSFAPKSIIGATFDSLHQRLFIGQAFGDGEYPLIHVFKLVWEENVTADAVDSESNNTGSTGGTGGADAADSDSDNTGNPGGGTGVADSESDNRADPGGADVVDFESDNRVDPGGVDVVDSESDNRTDPGGADVVDSESDNRADPGDADVVDFESDNRAEPGRVDVVDSGNMEFSGAIWLLIRKRDDNLQ